MSATSITYRSIATSLRSIQTEKSTVSNWISIIIWTQFFTWTAARLTVQAGLTTCSPNTSVWVNRPIWWWTVLPHYVSCHFRCFFVPRIIVSRRKLSLVITATTIGCFGVWSGGTAWSAGASWSTSASQLPMSLRWINLIWVSVWVCNCIEI